MLRYLLGEIIHEQNGDEFLLKLGFCLIEYLSHLRLCFAFFSCLATDPL